VLREAIVALALTSHRILQVVGCSAYDGNTLDNDAVAKRALDNASKASHERQLAPRLA
jgi:hypothetical protein